jgi:hypothetical protein
MRCSYSPTWEGPIEGWTVNYLKNQAWRTEPEMDLDDLVQEAFLIFDKCAGAYPRVTSPSHFMSLYKTSIINRVHRLAGNRSRRKEVHVTGKNEEGELVDGLELIPTGFEEQEDVEIRLLMEDLPGPIFRVLKAAMDGDLEQEFVRSEGIRETTNQFLCRIAEIDSSQFNIIRCIRNLFRGHLCTESLKASM